MPDRFFVETAITGDRATLAGAEAHHLLHVLRAKPGDAVVLFDGGGAEFLARVESCGRSEVVCAIERRNDVDRESPFRSHLAVALPKGDRQKWLVEKLVELGAARLTPLATERSVATPNAKALERLRRSVIEASKQCGRNVLMEIAEPARWEAFVATSNDDRTDNEYAARRYVAHPGGGNAVCKELDTHGDATLAVGPEGGFTDDEIAIAQSAGWKTIDLGPRILRIETAAVALAAMLNHGSRG